jgi:hypothetical protein
LGICPLALLKKASASGTFKKAMEASLQIPGIFSETYLHNDQEAADMAIRVFETLM